MQKYKEMYLVPTQGCRSQLVTHQLNSAFSPNSEMSGSIASLVRTCNHLCSTTFVDDDGQNYESEKFIQNEIVFSNSTWSYLLWLPFGTHYKDTSQLFSQLILKF